MKGMERGFKVQSQTEDGNRLKKEPLCAAAAKKKGGAFMGRDGDTETEGQTGKKLIMECRVDCQRKAGGTKNCRMRPRKSRQGFG